MSQYIQEAFKKFRLLEDYEEFPLTPEGLDNLGSFMGQALDDEDVDVIDLEAEVKEDLKKSYVGKVICDCNVCHSNIFYDKEDIIVDEDGIANIDDECPYCMSTDGYTIVGEIKEWNPESEEEVEIDSEEELADEPIEIEDEEETEVVEEGLKLDGVKSLRGTKGLRRRPDKNGVKSLRGRANSKISGTEDLTEAYAVDIDWETDGEDVDLPTRVKLPAGIDDEDVADYLSDTYGWLVNGCNIEGKLNESIEDVTINTEDETMTMTTKEDGGVIVETSPKMDEELYDDFDMPSEEEEEVEISDDVEPGDEIIAPISDETEEEIMDDSEEEFSEEEIPEEEIPEEEVPEEEVEVSEFDEETFDGLGESYLRRCYDNVNGYNTSQVKVNNNTLIVEGIISFKSGSKKKTNFVFESKDSKNGKYIFEGYNAQINNGKPAFRLNCSIDNKTIVPVSLRYNYTSKNALNESIKLSGIVKSTRK